MSTTKITRVYTVLKYATYSQNTAQAPTQKDSDNMYDKWKRSKAQYNKKHQNLFYSIKQ